MASRSPEPVKIIACGAIAREIIAILARNGLNHISLTCLPAKLHNRPQAIPAAVEAEILEARQQGAGSVFVAYADCGTGGLLDDVCARHGVERIAGPHCYSFFSGNDRFAAWGEENMQTFFLTDFLARQFDAFVVRPLGLDRYPQLRNDYFGNYRKLVFLAQSADPELDDKAREAADFLGLAYERRFTGMGDLEEAVSSL